MERIRCKNCGYTVNISNVADGYVKCPACGGVLRSTEARQTNVRNDGTRELATWREYLSNRLRAQQDSGKPDYVGVRLFAQKILFAFPDDFRARYYCALADRFTVSDEAFLYFLENTETDSATADELREVVASLIDTAQPEYRDAIKSFIARAYPQTHSSYEAALERRIDVNIRARSSSTLRDVFICYGPSALGGDVANAVCERLEERGLRCWIAPRNILAGSGNSDRDINKGVEDCSLFLFVSDAGSVGSTECERRLKTAVDAGKPIYIYGADDTPYGAGIADMLGFAPRLDASDDPYARIEELVIEVKNELAMYSRAEAERERALNATREAERDRENAKYERERERLAAFERGEGITKMRVGNSSTKLKRAELELSSGNFERAERIIDGVLDTDPENGLAWWLMILTDNRAKSDDELVAGGIDFTKSGYLDNALKFADPASRERIATAVANTEKYTVKSVASTLRKAETAFENEDFDALDKLLDSAAHVFEDGRSIVYSRYPDVASKYFRLRLWAKYGQTSLVCVEDITRESEYKSALLYASPTQKVELERERDTVSENAAQFLRERSKDPKNDGKLSDYIMDNKGILPNGVYNHYSSLLYFRKMLSTLGMTEEQLASSSIDITANEYFMLAQALATDDQREKYDALVDRLAANREARRRENGGTTGTTLSECDPFAKRRNRTGAIATAVISYALFTAAAVLYAVHNGAALYMFAGAALFRLINDVIGYADASALHTRVLNKVNLAVSIVSLVLIFSGDFVGTVLFNLTAVGNVAATVVEGINIHRIKKAVKKDKDDSDNGGGNGRNG